METLKIEEWNGADIGTEMEETEIVRHLFVVCRLCITRLGKYAIVPSTPIHTAIQEIFAVKIEPYDGLSQLLCVECREKLLEIQNLRNTFIMNQKILASMKSNHKNNSVQLKSEVDQREEAPADPEDISSEKRKDHNNEPVINGVEVRPENSEAVVVKPEIEKSTEEENITYYLTTQNVNNTDNVTTEKIKLRAENVEEENVTTFISDADFSDLDELQAPSCINGYAYHCRFCSDNFETIAILKMHLKLHSNLIMIQRRYAPYGCSVKLLRTLGESSNEATGTGRYHPLFYVKKKKEVKNKTEDHLLEDGFASGDDFDSPDNLNNPHDFDMSDNIDMPDDTNAIFHSNISVHFKEGSGMVPPATDPDESFSATGTGRYHPLFYDKKKKEVKNKIEDHLLEDGFASGDDFDSPDNLNNPDDFDMSDNIDMPDHTNAIFHSNISVHFKEGSGMVPPATDPDESFSANFGSILRETCSILDQDDEESKPVIIYSPNEEHISEIILSRIAKNQTYLANTELIQIQQILLHMCKKNIKFEWKKTEDEYTVINLHLAKPTSFKPIFHKNLFGYTLVPKEPEENEGKEENIFASTVPKGTKVHNSNSSKKKKNTSAAPEPGNHSSKKIKNTCAAPELEKDSSKKNKCAVPELEKDSNVSEVVTADATTEREMQAATPLLPVIVSTTSLEPSVESDSTSVYIDLEDEAHTLSSDQSPIMFLKLILEKHGMDLSLKHPDPESSSLCCFKKIIDNENVYISLHVKDTSFYLGVSLGKVQMDLEKACFITQWHILSSLRDHNIERLIRNYAKISPKNYENVDRFIRIACTISGKIQGKSVSMEAPSKFFF